MIVSRVPIGLILAAGCLLLGAVVAERGHYVGCYADPNGADRATPPARAGNLESCINRCADGFYNYAILSYTSCWCAQNTSIAQEVERSSCSTTCPQNPDHFCGGPLNLRSFYDVALTLPGPPTDVRLTNRTATSITLTWTPPPHQEILKQYSVNAKILHTFANTSLIPPEWIVSGTESRIELVNLHPATAYNFTIVAASIAGSGGAVTIRAQTEIGLPEPQPEQPKIVAQTETTRTIEIRPAVNLNGPISFYRVLVTFIDSSIVREFDESLLGTYQKAQEDGTNYYVAAELEPFDRVRRFTVGDGRSYRGYTNAVLPAGAHVHVSVGVVSVQDGVEMVRYAETSHEQHDVVIDVKPEEEADGQALVVTLIVACVIFGLLLIASIVVYVMLRIRMDRRLQRLPSDHHELTLQGPIVEVENGAYIPDDYLVKGNFEQKLAQMLADVDPALKMPRKALDLEVNNVLGTGNYGDVIRGHIHQSRVQVHVVSDDMEPLDQSQFLKDLRQTLHIAPHPNVLRFMGACQTPDWLYLLFEDTPYTLKKRLIDARIAPNMDAQRLSAFSEEFVLRLLFEVAGAMEYLGQQQFVHRKLCSYNVRMTIDDDVKVSCFGAVPFDEHGNRVEMARWSSLEVLRFQHYSAPSDVWSFGCLMWECCTLGGTLYPNISAGDLAPRIKSGAKPEQAPFLYDDVYQLMLNCWQLEPSDRPHFTDIVFALRQLMTSPRHVLSFDRRDGVVMPFYLPLMEVEQSQG